MQSGLAAAQGQAATRQAGEGQQAARLGHRGDIHGGQVNAAGILVEFELQVRVSGREAAAEVVEPGRSRDAQVLQAGGRAAHVEDLPARSVGAKDAVPHQVVPVEPPSPSRRAAASSGGSKSFKIPRNRRTWVRIKLLAERSNPLPS